LGVIDPIDGALAADGAVDYHQIVFFDAGILKSLAHECPWVTTLHPALYLVGQRRQGIAATKLVGPVTHSETEDNDLPGWAWVAIDVEGLDLG
jgi:hypothetical protein